jgi:hypothetical protein
MVPQKSQQTFQGSVQRLNLILRDDLRQAAFLGYINGMGDGNCHALATVLTTVAGAATKAAKMVKKPSRKSYVPRLEQGRFASVATLVNYELQELWMMGDVTVQNVHNFAARARRLARLAHEFCEVRKPNLSLVMWSVNALKAGDDLWVTYNHSLGMKFDCQVWAGRNLLPVVEKNPKPGSASYKFVLPEAVVGYEIHVKAQVALGRYFRFEDFTYPVNPKSQQTSKGA